MNSAPLLLATWSFGARGNEAAWPELAAGGSSLDAAVDVCRHVEDDPLVDSVGFGGLPDRDGRISCDAAVMLSPSRIGGVCAVRGFAHPVDLARDVLDLPHVLLAAEGAERFARARGRPRRDLLSDEARETWRRRRGALHRVNPDGEEGAGKDARGASSASNSCPAEGGHRAAPPAGDARGCRCDDHRPGLASDTVCAIARDRAGVIAAATSTSGLAFKHPGRVGDSPLPGHGLYVDPAVGAAVVTGTGELAIGVCAAFLAVERLRQGDAPDVAAAAPLLRIVEEYLIGPDHQLAVLALARDGEWASAALRPGYRTAVRTEGGAELRDAARVILPDPVQ